MPQAEYHQLSHLKVKSKVPDYFDAQSYTYPEMERAIGQALISDEVQNFGKVTPENIRFFQQVQLFLPNGGRITSATVHYFNERGVLVGRVYAFVPYEMLRQHEHGVIRSWKSKYYGSDSLSGQLIESIKRGFITKFLDLTSFMIKYAQKFRT